MKLSSFVGPALIVGGLALAFSGSLQAPKPAPAPTPVDPAPIPAPPAPAPSPAPCPGPGPCPAPKPKPSPWRPFRPHQGDGSPVGEVVIDGPTHAGLDVTADLPVSLRKKNIGGTDGAGLCVFTSIMHSARFQNVRALFQFQEQMSHERGGGYPEKVDRMIAKYAPGTQYLQYEGKDPLTVCKQVLASGRMPAVTWDGYHDPHYGGSHIAHMVNCVYADDSAVCLLDNNFIGDNQMVWMSPADFTTGCCDGGNGWVVVLLAPGPIPMPVIPK